MKRVVRPECFETNSSSVHSLSVISKSSANVLCELVKDNVLYPDVFYNTVKRFHGDHGIDYIYDEGKRWYAVTRDEKAALLFLYLNYVKLAFEGDTDFASDSFDENMILNAIEIAEELLPYDSIHFGENSISPFQEDKGEMIINIGDVLSKYGSKDQKELERIIGEFCTLILDDDKILDCVQGEG